MLQLQEPNPEDPLNKEAAEVLQTNRRLFETNVQKSMRGGYIGSVSIYHQIFLWCYPYEPCIETMALMENIIGVLGLDTASKLSVKLTVLSLGLFWTMPEVMLISPEATKNTNVLDYKFLLLEA